MHSIHKEIPRWTSKKPECRLRSHCPELGHPIDLAAGAVATLRNMIIIIDLDTLIHSCLGAEQEITLNRVSESK